MSSLLTKLTKLSGLLILTNLTSQIAVAAEKATAVPITEVTPSTFRAVDPRDLLKDLTGITPRYVEIDLERATTPEIVKFFVRDIIVGRICCGRCPRYVPNIHLVKPEHTQALVQRANTRPKTTVFRALNRKHVMTREDLFKPLPDNPAGPLAYLVRENDSVKKRPIDAAANDAVQRRILANFDMDRSCCAFRCGKKGPATPTTV